MIVTRWLIASILVLILAIGFVFGIAYLVSHPPSVSTPEKTVWNGVVTSTRTWESHSCGLFTCTAQEAQEVTVLLEDGRTLVFNMGCTYYYEGQEVTVRKVDFLDMRLDHPSGCYQV